MPKDRKLASATYDGGNDVQAFPLGGDTAAVAISTTSARALTSADLHPEISLFTVDIPAGRTLFVGRLDRDAALTPDQKRAKWFPLVGGTQRTFSLTDELQPVTGFIADASGDLAIRILEAGIVGGAS